MHQILTMKTVYQTDSAGHFVCEVQADESPLERGVFLIPAGCVEEAPPADVPAGQWPRWNGTAWDLVAMPSAAVKIDAVAKLRAFLAANPDVAAVINQGGV